MEKQKLAQELKAKESEKNYKAQEDDSKAKLIKVNEDTVRSEAKANRSKLLRDKLWGWLKFLIALVATLVLIIALLIGLYRLYRWATEEPLIKEVQKTVEVEKIVEKEIPVEVEVEKEVIPEECTQIRRNGKVYISCDGVKVEGSPTIGDSGLTQIPELITE